MDAHLLMARLESEAIECWLQDENSVTTYPVWANAIGGIKLMVKKEDYARAVSIYRESEHHRKQAVVCPKCNSHNVELVSTPRKASNWLSALFTGLAGGYAMGVDKVNHCFDCGHEFPNSNETETDA